MRVAAQRLTRERKTREDAVLEAARKLFREKGVVGTTMDEIAESSEFSKPTIYAYFHSKNDIICILLTRRMKHLSDLLDDLDLPKEPRKRLAEIGGAMIEYMADDDYASDLSFPIEADFRLPDLSETVREGLDRELGRVFSRLEDLIADGERAGVFIKGWDARRLAIFAWGMLVGIAALTKRFHPDILADPSQAVYAEVLKIVSRGLVKE
jgi:AcrR family transcriptional regulator